MFDLCESFNQPLEWDVSNVTNMSSMFENCESFNQPLEWDVSNVTVMSYMFENCESFRGPLTWIGGDWDVSSVNNMSHMFYNCVSFTQNLSNWDVRSVRYHENTFDHCPCPQPRFLNLAGIVAFEGPILKPQKRYSQNAGKSRKRIKGTMKTGIHAKHKSRHRKPYKSVYAKRLLKF